MSHRRHFGFESWCRGDCVGLILSGDAQYYHYCHHCGYLVGGRGEKKSQQIDDGIHRYLSSLAAASHFLTFSQYYRSS